jgi:hypothetical protein
LYFVCDAVNYDGEKQLFNLDSKKLEIPLDAEWIIVVRNPPIHLSIVTLPDLPYFMSNEGQCQQYNTYPCPACHYHWWFFLLRMKSEGSGFIWVFSRSFYGVGGLGGNGGFGFSPPSSSTSVSASSAM